jgi:hypothetical protein
MSALAIAHKALKGDLNNTEQHYIRDKFLYLRKGGVYFTFINKQGNNKALTYISTTEQFINFKGDNMTDKTYTQEMADNGECPKLGSEFTVGDVDIHSRIFDFKGKEVEVIGLSVAKGCKQAITFQHPTMGIGCGLFDNSWVKSLTPPIELIDGKAYQFYIEEVANIFQAIWSEERQQMCTEHSYFYKGVCENIQPLTVETK